MNYDILAVGPHPDDVEIGCGGTLIDSIDRGYRVGIVDLTEARLSTRGDEEIRRNEAARAFEIIGAEERIQLELYEGGLAPTGENIPRLVSLIRKTRPYTIFAPYWEDRHPDHRDASNLVQTACFWAGVSKYGDSQSPHRPHRIVYYFLHWEGPITFIVDASSAFDRKLKAIRAYHTQFSVQPDQRGMTYISRPEFLEKIINRARFYGSSIGVEYGEPFLVREAIRMEDVAAWVHSQGVVG